MIDAAARMTALAANVASYPSYHTPPQAAVIASWTIAPMRPPPSASCGSVSHVHHATGADVANKPQRPNTSVVALKETPTAIQQHGDLKHEERHRDTCGVTALLEEAAVSRNGRRYVNR
jgi:hypothetical protein